MFLFGNPVFLYGLTAAAVPVIIHFIHTHRAKIKPFSTLRFLRFSVRKHARKFRMENLLLLFLRMGVIALIALAFAEPVMKVSKFPLAGKGAPSSVVVILDNSYSMGYREEGISLFDMALETGIDILDTLDASDEITIILMNEEADVIFKEFTHDVPLAKEHLTGAKLSYKGTNAGKTLKKAFELLKESENANMEIHLLSDFRENGWHGLFEEGNYLLPAELEISEEVGVYLVPFGKANAANVFIENVDLPPYRQVAGVPVEFSVKIVNAGTKPVDEIITLSVDGIKKLKVPVLLKPGTEKVKMTHTFREPALYAGKVSIRGDRLIQDDSRYFDIQVEDKINVLCVDGSPSSVSALAESFYIVAALSPVSGCSSIVPERIEVSQLKSSDLFKYGVIVFCNVPYLEGADLINIERYLKAGGNLILFLGSMVSPDKYNKWEFVPSQILNPEGYPGRESYFNLGIIDYTHPVFRKFNFPGNGDLTIPRFYQCYSVKEVPGCRILARFSNGFPAFLERSYGEGKVIMVTTTAGSDWTNLPLRAVYLPLVHQMVHYMSGRKAEEKYLIGQPVNLRTAPGEPGRITVTNPAGAKFALVPSPWKDFGLTVFRETELPGIYRVSGISLPNRKKRFAVNLNTVESILARINLSAAEKLFGRIPVTIIDNPGELPSIVKRSRQGQELWSKLLLLAMILFIAELFLSNRMSRKGKGAVNAG